MKTYLHALATVMSTWIISTPVGLLASTFWLHDVNPHSLDLRLLLLVAGRSLIAALIPCAVGLWMLYTRRTPGVTLMVTLGVAVLDTAIFVAASVYLAHRLSAVGWAS
jgi:hypothetical protein